MSDTPVPPPPKTDFIPWGETDILCMFLMGARNYPLRIRSLGREWSPPIVPFQHQIAVLRYAAHLKAQRKKQVDLPPSPPRPENRQFAHAGQKIPRAILGLPDKKPEALELTPALSPALPPALSAELQAHALRRRGSIQPNHTPLLRDEKAYRKTLRGVYAHAAKRAFAAVASVALALGGVSSDTPDRSKGATPRLTPASIPLSTP